jgi:RNA polymerase sigma-70 factor (ECF subfamily)
MQQVSLAKYIPHLRRYASKLIGDRHSADDLVQDTLERGLNKIHLWRPGSDIRAWLFSVMHNVFVNQRRVQKPEIGLLDEDLLDFTSQATPLDRIALAEVERALETISAEQREVLMLVAVDQKSYAETADALGIPIGTVMSRLSRARECLRQQINGRRS